MDTISDAKNLMEAGWKARENLDFNTAEDLLQKAKQMFEQSQDWFNVTECINHLAYTQKLKSQQIQSEAIKLAKESLDLATTKGTKDTLVLRALISVLDSAGKFEEALIHAQKALEQYDKPSSKSDILCHISMFQLRTGKMIEAEKSLNEAESLMNQGWDMEKEPFRSIWKVKLLLTKGLILYNINLKEDATTVGKEALELAKNQDLKTRIKQAEDFLTLIGK